MSTARLTFGIGNLVLVCGFAFADGADDTAPRSGADGSRKAEASPRILFNSDGGKGALYHFEPPVTPEQLCRVQEDLRGTQVDVFIQCINHSADQFVYPTKIAELYGANVKNGGFEEDGFRKWALNVRSLLDAGHDPLEVWARNAHKLGMQFWPSMRMNDIHQDEVDRWPSLRSEWEKQHRDLLIGAGVSDRYFALYKRRYSWIHDYAKQEVRDRKFALIEEMCLNYDVDGFELDFQRHPYYFRKDEERRGATLMTRFVRRVRGRLDEIGKNKRRKLVLQVRVPRTLEMCEQIGLDVRTWIRDALVDYVTTMDPGYLDMNADVRGFVEAARGTKCRIAAGLELYVKGYGARRATIEMMRAASLGYFNEGAASVYLFNFDAHGHVPLSDQERKILVEIGDPRKIARKNKHYFITIDSATRTPEEGGTTQLPLDLGKDRAERRFRLTVGDDLESAKRDGALQSVTLKVTSSPPKRKLGVRFNGQDLSQGQVKKGSIIFENAPARQGSNELTIALLPSSKNEPQESRVRITRIELLVNYKPSGVPN